MASFDAFCPNLYQANNLQYRCKIKYLRYLFRTIPNIWSRVSNNSISSKIDSSQGDENKNIYLLYFDYQSRGGEIIENDVNSIYV